MCGLAVAVAKDYPVCARCYAVQQQTPAQIIRDLAERSGQVLWPQIDDTFFLGGADCTLLPSSLQKQQDNRYKRKKLFSVLSKSLGVLIFMTLVYDKFTCEQAIFTCRRR